MSTRVEPERNSRMITSRVFWSMSPCVALTVKSRFCMACVSQSTCAQSSQLQYRAVGCTRGCIAQQLRPAAKSSTLLCLQKLACTAGNRLTAQAVLMPGLSAQGSCDAKSQQQESAAPCGGCWQR